VDVKAGDQVKIEFHEIDNVRRSRSKGLAIGFAVAFAVAGCTGVVGPSAGPKDTPGNPATQLSNLATPATTSSFAPERSLTSAVSSSMPSPSPQPLTLTSNGPVPIEAGAYSAIPPFLVPLSFTVPGHWSGSEGGPYAVFLAQTYGADYVDFSIFTKVYADPCHNDKGLLTPLPGSSVDDLVTALKDMPSVTVSPVTDVTIAGVAAKHLTLTAPDNFLSCTLSGDGQFRLWELPFGATNDLDPGDSQNVYVLEVDGQRLVIDNKNVPGDIEGTGILNSIVFSPQL